MTLGVPPRRAWLVHAALLAFGLHGPAARADTLTVTLGAFQMGGREQYVPTAQFPASESFDLDLPAADPAVLQARVEIWPGRHGRAGGPDECGAPQTGSNQYHALAMTPVGDGATRVLRAHVPPLQLGRQFCLLVTRTRTVSPAEARATATLIVSTHRQIVEQGQYRDYAAFEAELGRDIEGGLKSSGLGDEGGRALAARRAAPIAATTFYYSPAAAAYLQALAKREAAAEDLEKANQRKDPALIAQATRADAQARAEVKAQQTPVATNPADAVPAALQDVRFDLATPAAPLPASASTLDPNNYASVDAGVALGMPLVKSGADFRTQVLPYVGLNLYSTAVERNVPLDQLTGSWLDTLRQRVSLTVGVTLENPSSPGWTVKPVLLGKVPLVAIGYRMTQYTRLSAGLIVFLLGSRNPVEDRSRFGSAAFVGYSIDFDVLTLLRTGLSKV